MIIFIVQERNPDLRKAFYELFETLLLDNQTLVVELIKALRNNLKNYEEDRQEIYKCAVKLGKTYSRFININLMNLLQHNESFILQEKDVDDPLHVMNFIILSNALAAPSSNLEVPEYYYR